MHFSFLLTFILSHVLTYIYLLLKEDQMIGKILHAFYDFSRFNLFKFKFKLHPIPSLLNSI